MKKYIQKEPIKPSLNEFLNTASQNTKESIKEMVVGIKKFFTLTKDADISTHSPSQYKKVTPEEVQEYLKQLTGILPDELSVFFRGELIRAALKEYELDKFIDATLFDSICKTNNLDFVEGVKVFKLIKDCNLSPTLIHNYDKQDYSTLKSWDLSILGKVPDLLSNNLQKWITLTEYKKIKQSIHLSYTDTIDVLKLLHRCEFPKVELFNLVTDDFKALLECRGFASKEYRTPYDRYSAMSEFLKGRLHVWLIKASNKLVYIKDYTDTLSLGEVLHYFTQLSSEPLPKEVAYTLHLLRIAMFYFTGVILPNPKTIYLAAIWLVMLSLMTKHSNFDGLELGATIVSVLAHIINYVLYDDSIKDTSKLLASDNIDIRSDLSADTRSRLQDDHLHMIEAWNQTLEVLLHSKSLNSCSSSRMLVTYSIGTSYIRYISRPLDIKKLINGISPIPNRYSFHNIIKLFRSDDEYVKRQLLLDSIGNSYTSNITGQSRKLKLAFAPYSERGVRGDFCNISLTDNVHYYPTSLSQIHKADIKKSTTSNLPITAPLHSGDVVFGMLDIEDIFAEEEAVNCRHKVSVKNDIEIKRYASLAAHCYGKLSIDLMGCKIIETKSSKNDLRAVVYAHGSTEIICAFAGTSTYKDVINDILQPLGVSPQYNEALIFGKEVCNKYKDKEIVFVGHSMGGGEAVYCALECGKNAYTFNPAGLGEITLSSLYLNRFTKEDLYKIHAYVFRGDILNIFQDICDGLGILDIRADGICYDVYDYKPKGISFDELHGMKGILNYFGVTASSYKTESSVCIRQLDHIDKAQTNINVIGIIKGSDDYVILECEVITGSISNGDKIYLFRNDGALIMSCKIKTIFINNKEVSQAASGQTFYLRVNGPMSSIAQCVKISKQNISDPTVSLCYNVNVKEKHSDILSPINDNTFQFSVYEVHMYKETCTILRGKVDSGQISVGDTIYLYRKADQAMIVACKVLSIRHNNIAQLSTTVNQQIDIVINVPLNSAMQCYMVRNR